MDNELCRVKQIYSKINTTISLSQNSLRKLNLPKSNHIPIAPTRVLVLISRGNYAQTLMTPSTDKAVQYTKYPKLDYY